MNTNILKKVLEELGKEKPDISYVRGMIETLVALEEKSTEPIVVASGSGGFPPKAGIGTITSHIPPISEPTLPPPPPGMAQIAAEANKNVGWVKKSE